ncbi:MAG: hypothetical protein GXO98_06965 [Nitrospirae bacterium]|nr:hypothetical protein [Nitrospirota bacterium]
MTLKHVLIGLWVCLSLVWVAGYSSTVAAPSEGKQSAKQPEEKQAGKSGQPKQTNELQPLPEGLGLAAKYPGDKGIEKDPAVVFADDFEDSASAADLRKKWDVVIHPGNISIADESAKNSGKRSLLLTIKKRTSGIATGVAKLLKGKEAQDVLFLRWYTKFDKDWFVPSGSVHNGGSISSQYFPGGRATPGVPGNGRNKFLANFENENSTGKTPGNMNIYLYHAEQPTRWGDHFYPSGKVLPFSWKRSGTATFGKQFVGRPDFSPKRGVWLCYEFMVKANTPGKHDGRIGMWLNGKLIGDFPNLRMRDIKSLMIDRFGVGVYIAKNTKRTNRKWYDNIVAATSYIGPMVTK